MRLVITMQDLYTKSTYQIQVQNGPEKIEKSQFCGEVRSGEFPKFPEIPNFVASQIQAY